MHNDHDSRATYLSFLLRLWQSGSRDGRPVWRASLEYPHSGERLAFVSPQALFEFLAGLTTVRDDAGADVPPGNTSEIV